jgi:hypothetical protein
MSDLGRPAEYRVYGLLDASTGQLAYIGAGRGHPRHQRTGDSINRSILAARITVAPRLSLLRRVER